MADLRPEAPLLHLEQLELVLRKLFSADRSSFIKYLKEAADVVDYASGDKAA